MKKLKLPALILVLVLALALFSGCSRLSSLIPSGSPSPVSQSTAAVMASDYKEVFDALNSFSLKLGYGSSTGVTMEAASDDAGAPMPSSAPVSDSVAEMNAGADYSETNVQVAGIDEGDVVKTDGSYIYILSNSELKIVKADGAGSRLVSSTSVGSDSGYNEESGESVSKYPYELYVSGGKLAVLSNYSYYREYTVNGNWNFDSQQTVYLDIYDVSDPASPKLLHSLGQDGYNLASRMADGIVYLVTSYNVYDISDENDPNGYVPCVYTDGTKELVAASSIAIMPQMIGTGYTVVSSYDLGAGSRISNQNLLGGGSTVYMDADTLYVACGIYDDGASEPRRDGVYTVVDYKSRAKTEISRFDLSGGSVSLSATGTVDGYLVDQFAMDEYNGHLRVVTTLSGSDYSSYTDEERGFVNYIYDDEGYTQTNALYILDSDMELTGSVTGLAEDEQVYSVRFDGDIGYFVTFRQTDPLFAVDLSDPASPKVLSALKIPGFSEYLHVYGEGRLFGLGMNADEETGRTDTMKLTMFNTENPADVTEKWSLALDSYWSEALYNHKAILVSPENDLIAFPVDSGYAVYGYADDGGFTLRGHFETDEWSYNMRGLYIGENIYICSDSGVNIVSLSDLSAVGYVSF